MFIFTINSPPVPEKQTLRGKGRYYNPNAKATESIVWQIRPYAPSQPIEGPVQVDYMFYLPIPKGVSKSRFRSMVLGQELPCKRPDVDNLAYLITNAMKNLVYVDDSQICDMSIHKRYGEEPRTVIKVFQY